MREAVETRAAHPAHLEAGHVVADALGGIGQQVAKRCSQRGQRVALRLRKGRKMRSDRIVGATHVQVLSLRQTIEDHGCGGDRGGSVAVGAVPPTMSRTT